VPIRLDGAGRTSFTAGLDLNGPGRPERKRAVRNYHQALTDCAVPIIGAINGYAVGHGITVCSALDMLLASENASFGSPGINTGIASGGRFLLKLFPPGVAHHAAYTGNRIDAHEAHRLGAVLEVVPPEHLMDKAIALATTIAQKPPAGIRTAKTSLRWVEDMDPQRGYEFEGDHYGRHYLRTAQGRAEADEARRSFLEKRAPQFP
jgi:enoyl-CoA hydratase/carnithine racemase